MPLTEREREELARKINQQRRAMWKGQTTDELQAKKEQKPEKNAPTIERQKKQIEPEQTPEPYHQVGEKEPIEKHEESKKEKLAKKIKQQRRAVWGGKPDAKSKTNKRKSRSVKKILERHQEPEPIKQNQLNERRAKAKSRDYQSKAPTLKLALLVIIGLIGMIAIGITIGYLAAVRDLIKI